MGQKDRKLITHEPFGFSAHRDDGFTRLKYSFISFVDGGGNTNPGANSHLAAAIDRAKQDGVPASTIQNALKKADEKDDSKPYALEVRGLSGTFFIIEVLTNNIRRTKQTLQPALNKCKLVQECSEISNMFLIS